LAEEGFLMEVKREIGRLREELEELRLMKSIADNMRSLRRRLLSREFD